MTSIQKAISNFLSDNLHEKKTPLCEIMQRHGSDKFGGHHNYTTLYYHVFLGIKDQNLSILELGLGSNDLSIKSNMSGAGTPCGSLRAWKEFFTNSKIFGADIDEKILIKEDNITTYACDQTSKESIENLWNCIGDEVDIIVDDGLHEFEANKNFFIHSIQHLKKGGIYIIEDIRNEEYELFNKFVNSQKSNYEHAELIKIPHDRNKGDNCLAIIKK